MRAAIIAVAILVQGADPLVADTATCSTWQQITTCAGPGGYVSHETTWNGIMTGSDNQGGKWTTSRWRDVETTTVEPPPER